MTATVQPGTQVDPYPSSTAIDAGADNPAFSAPATQSASNDLMRALASIVAGIVPDGEELAAEVKETSVFVGAVAANVREQMTAQLTPAFLVGVLRDAPQFQLLISAEVERRVNERLARPKLFAMVQEAVAAWFATYTPQVIVEHRVRLVRLVSRFPWIKWGALAGGIIGALLSIMLVFNVRAGSIAGVTNGDSWLLTEIIGNSNYRIIFVVATTGMFAALGGLVGALRKVDYEETMDDTPDDLPPNYFATQIDTEERVTA